MKTTKIISLVFLIVVVIMDFGCEQLIESDTTPPDISITSPTNGATVSDTVTIKTLVADNEGVKSVEFYVDDYLIATINNEPFQTDWDTKTFDNGKHTLICKAIDESDNESLSGSIIVTVKNILLTATFQDDWVCPGCSGGILFYSDMDGNLLWAGTFTGGESIEILPTEENPNFPDRIMVTTVAPNATNEYIEITTNTYVKPESWTWKGNPYWYLREIGDVALDLQNIPSHQGYIVTTKWHRRSGGTLSSPYYKTLYDSPDNLYFRVNTDTEGPAYLWLENVQVGESRSVDLSNLQQLTSKVIHLPTDGEEISFILKAFLNDDYYSGFYDIDVAYGFNYDQSSNTYTAYYPTGLFTGFRSRLFLNEETYPTNNWWRHWVIDDDLPDIFQKMDADFEFISTSPTNFEIQITGNYTGTGSYWSYNDGGREFNWRVWGPLDSYTLPEFPDIFQSDFPDVSRESFNLEHANIDYRPQLENNYDYLYEILFQSDDRFYDIIKECYERSKDPDGLRP